jgi:hypothetical protein
LFAALAAVFAARLGVLLLPASVALAADPPLTFVESQKDGGNGGDFLDGMQATVISADGKHLYAISYGDDAVSLFDRNPSTPSTG